MSEYVPFGWEDVAFTPYHTVVTSLVATEPVLLTWIGLALDGTPAQVDELDALLVSAEYADAPNPPALTIR